MPYAQVHYPFENKEALESGKCYPADFIAEGVDQTRGWFFTLHAIAGMVFDTVSFKAVISNGLVLDKDGNKMSKRLGTAVDPFKTIEAFGSDPVRWYMIANSAPWDNLKFNEEGIKEVSRKLFSTLYNTYSFLTLYANVDGFTGAEPQVAINERPEIDRWILSLLNTLIKNVQEALDDYEPTRAARAINDFVNDNLSNWYVRLNRKRFWGGGLDADKLSAYQTLHTCLTTIAKLLAPFAPFFADRLYRDLTAPACEAQGKDVVSVHLTDFPAVDESVIDADLESRMHLAQVVTSLVLSLRRKVNIKVRQPLQALMIPVNSEELRRQLETMAPLILSEVNVKDLKLVDDQEGVLVKSIKPDFKKLGPKFGKKMKAVAARIGAMTQQEIAKLERDAAITLQLEGEEITVELTDVDIHSEDIPGWLVANEGSVTVALEVEITDELRKEGVARDLINRIQNIRKSRNYDITDRINVVVEPNELTDGAVADFKDYIASQVLAATIASAPVTNPAEDEVLDIDGVEVKVTITKA
jgi:isoleucyl-tRNA synthetase